MKIHLIKKKTIENFALNHVRGWISFKNWLTIIKLADWKEPNDIIRSFSSADILGKGSQRVVFDIAGNNYRIICKYNFGKNHVRLFIKWIGTHTEYSKLCNENKQYTVNKFK